MEINEQLFVIFEVIVAFLATIGNFIVCYVIWKSIELSRKVMYLFIFSLAISDIFVGMIAIPFSILTKFGIPYNQPYICLSMLSFIMIPTQISIFSMGAIAIERYFAIKHPVLHVTLLNASKAKVAVVLTWVLSFIVGILPLLGWNSISSVEKALNVTQTNVTTQECVFMEVMSFDYMTFNFLACVFPPLCITAVFYAIIFWSVRKTEKEKAAKRMSDRSKIRQVVSICNNSKVTSKDPYYEENVDRASINNKPKINKSHLKLSYLQKKIWKNKRMKKEQISQITIENPNAIGNNTSNNLRLAQSSLAINQIETTVCDNPKKEVKIATVLAFIVFSFIICWMPIHILNMIFRFNEDVHIPKYLFDAAVILSHLSSALNFFLYSLRLRSFQIYLKKRMNIFRNRLWK